MINFVNYVISYVKKTSIGILSALLPRLLLINVIGSKLLI